MDGFLEFFKDRTQGNPMQGTGLRFSGDIGKDIYENDIPETDEGYMFLGLAYTACLLGGTSVTWDIAAWEDISYTVKFPRRYVPIVNNDDNTMIRGRNSSNGIEPEWTPGNSTIDDYGVYVKDNINVCPDSDARVVFRLVYNGEKDWKQFYLDLLNAYQISGLTHGHVSSYLKWNKVVGIEGEYISKNFGKLTGGAPAISETEETRALLRAGKWTEYRSSFATITGVVKRMFDELPEEYMKIFTEGTKALVDDAARHSHDETRFRLIPEIVLAYAYAWNKVSKLDLEGLYSGKRAFESLSLPMRESMMNLLIEAKSKIKVWESSMISSVATLPNGLKDI